MAEREKTNLPTPVITYLHTDVVGSPIGATDKAGALAWREHYWPYGESNIRDPKTAKETLWFAGKPQDTESKLSYFGARYYDPLLGRFMGIDPVGVDESNVHSHNRYAYANNNPYRFVDPDGRASVLALPLAVLGTMAVYIGIKGTLDAIVQNNNDNKSDDPVKILTGNSAAASPGAMLPEGGGDDDKNNGLTKEDKKSIRSYEKNIKEHQGKIDAFKKNPTVKPGMEGMSKESIAAQQAERIKHLETEIQTFKNNIGKIVKGK